MIETDEIFAKHIRYSSIVDRPPLSWPGDAHVAFWVSPNIEFYEYEPPPSQYRRPWSRMPEPPDVMLYSHRDYGNRVGFWRMLEVFDQYAVRPTVSLNVACLERFPEITEEMVQRDWEYMSHGLYNTRYLFDMSPEEERLFLRDNIEIVRRNTGKDLKGFFGPAATTTESTMQLLAEEGFTYSADWFLDDQPFPIFVESEKLVGVPYTWEINDGLLMTYGFGNYESDYFLQACKDQFDVLYEEGQKSGRVMCLALHPYIIGHPHRIEYLDRALEYVLSHDGVWATTAEEIANYYVQNYYEAAVKTAKGV